MEADQKFGPCIPSERSVSDAELNEVPRSRQTLNATTAVGLKKYLESADTLDIPGVMHDTTPILWLVNKDGEVVFALEEVISLETGRLNYILPRNGPNTRPTEARLGHPSLLDKPSDSSPKAARIGGEIYFDPKNSVPEKWVISNNSGRFGKRSHIRREHLENVKAEFEKFGISLRTFYIPYRTREDGHV